VRKRWRFRGRIVGNASGISVQASHLVAIGAGRRRVSGRARLLFPVPCLEHVRHQVMQSRKPELHQVLRPLASGSAQRSLAAIVRC
jgi:hypothetical protein